MACAHDLLRSLLRESHSQRARGRKEGGEGVAGSERRTADYASNSEQPRLQIVMQIIDIVVNMEEEVVQVAKQQICPNLASMRLNRNLAPKHHLSEMRLVWMFRMQLSAYSPKNQNFTSEI